MRTGTNDMAVQHIQDIFKALDLLAGHALDRVNNAQKDTDDYMLELYAIEAHLAAMFDLLHDGAGYARHLL